MPWLTLALGACGSSSPAGASDAGNPSQDEAGADGVASGATSMDGGLSPACSSSSTGFSKSVEAFTVPTPRCQTAFDQAAGSGAVEYATLNLTGDRHPDLVVSLDTCDATVGTTHWDVYPWTPSGFAAAPSSFGVPTAWCQTKFDHTAFDGNVAYATIDLTADSHPDLVVFRDTCDTTVGSTHWDVYPWSPSGFTPSPTAFSVPTPRCQTKFDHTAVDGSVAYAMMDLTADAHLDLVVFRDACDATVGTTHWDVYPWSASGFAPSPVSFSIPTSRCQTKFDQTALDGPVAYATTDLTADGHPDLVVSRDACDATVGSTHWDVYPWSASGFAAAPASFGLPTARCQTKFDQIAFGGNSVSYAAMDLTARGRPDLVVFHDTCDATVGATHWDVYPWSSSGFAPSPTALGVPTARCMTAFAEAASAQTGLTYATMDLVSSCAPSLVVFNDACDKTVGQTHWDVYPMQ